MIMKKNVDFFYVFDTNERVFSITNRHFDNSINKKVSMEQVNVMVEELKDITGETFEVVNPDDGWFDGCVFDTSGLQLSKRFDDLNRMVKFQYDFYVSKTKKEDRKFYLLDNGLTRNTNRLMKGE